MSDQNFSLLLDPRDLWASIELCMDWMYQPSMDTMWHYWNQDEYAEAREKYSN